MNEYDANQEIYDANQEIINILEEHKIPLFLLNDDEFIKTYEPKDDEEIDLLMDALYIAADRKSAGQRTPENINRLTKIRHILDAELKERERDEIDEQERSESRQQNAAQTAERDRERTKLSVKKEKIEKMERLKKALKNPKVKDLLVKIRMRQMTPQQAFGAVKSKPRLNEQMMRTTLQGTRTGTRKKGGKSRIFRRKNKKTTSTSRRKVRGTRRHRKSYSRRSTRK